MNRVANAIRAVTARMQRAIEVGERPNAIHADDLIEALLAVADELDPPVRGAAKGARRRQKAARTKRRSSGH